MTTESRPVHQVLLSAGLPRENRLPKAAVGRGLGAIDISGLVKRIRTIKTIGQPNGTFELGLTFQSLKDAIPALTETRAMNMLAVPQNLCEISLGGGVKGRELTSVMQGVVTRVYERTALSEDGEPQREVVLAGEDWGNILANHELPAHHFSARIQGDVKRLYAEDTNGILLTGTCGDVNQRLYDAIFVKRTQALQLKTNQVFALDIDKSLFGAARGYIYQGDIWSRQGRFWTTLRSLADEPWNELSAQWNPEWVPQGPGDGLEIIPKLVAPSTEEGSQRKFVIRLRRRPFDKERWNALPTHTVTDDELRYHEAALADDERLNWIGVDPLHLMRVAGEQNLDFINYTYSRYDLDDAEAHGARRRRFPTAYGDMPSGRGTLLTDPQELENLAHGEGEAAKLYQDRVQFVWDAYNINHRLYRASWVVRGRPEIRVGDRVANQRDPSAYFVKEETERRVYYVETVVQDLLEGHHYFTHLGLTRGQKLDTFVTPWVDGRYQQRGMAAA